MQLSLPRRIDDRPTPSTDRISIRYTHYVVSGGAHNERVIPPDGASTTDDSNHAHPPDRDGVSERRLQSDLLVAGTIASSVALAASWIASTIAEGVVFAPLALAEAVIRATPGDVATLLIELLGHWAMRLLAGGAVLGALTFGAVMFRRTADEDGPRPVAAAAFVLVAAAAATLLSPSPDSELGESATALFISAVLYAKVGRFVHGELSRARDDLDVGRRRIIALGLGATGAMVAGAGVTRWLIERMAGPDRNVSLAPPTRAATAPARPPFPEIPGLSPEITAAQDHYVIDINIVKPSVEAQGWSLTVGGLVDEPLELDFGSLQGRFEVVEEFSVLSCISNEVGGELVGNSAWGGVRLKDVLTAAGVQPGAVDLVLRGADGYTDSIPVEVGRSPSTLLAVSQNGLPLTQEHGFPCRLRVPEIYGMKNVKWLESIEVVDRDYQGYWMDRGWSDEAVVKTQSRIDVAGDDGEAQSGEPTWVAGVAWAGVRGISSVEVSVDDGETWEEAMLKAPLAPNAWRLWAYRWTPSDTGTHRITCRAYDGPGEPQSADRSTPHPSGATGLPVVEVNVA